MIIAQSFSPPQAGVYFVASSGITYGTGTSMNMNIPACVDNDILIAAVMHRSAVTPASGWTLVDTASGTAGALSGGTHSVSIYSRSALTSISGNSTTWTQASNVRIAVIILNFRTTTGTLSIADHDNSHADVGTGPPGGFANSISTATDTGQMGVVFSTSPFGGSLVLSAGVGGVVQDTPVLVTDNRMCGGHFALSTGQTTTGFISHDADGPTGSWASVSLVIGH